MLPWQKLRPGPTKSEDFMFHFGAHDDIKKLTVQFDNKLIAHSGHTAQKT